MAALNSSGTPQQYCLKWNSFTSNMSEMFQEMLTNEILVDCTIACDGSSLKAHKLILSACSPYLQQLLISNPSDHPTLVLSDIKFEQLQAIIDFIYSGEVNIPIHELSPLLAAAETLKIKGLSDFHERQNAGDHSQLPPVPQPQKSLPQTHLNPLMHSTPLNKVLTMQNPAANHLAQNLSIPYNPYFNKNLKRKRTRNDIAPSSLHNLSAITRNSSLNLAKLNKQMINSLVKPVPGVDKARLEAANLFIKNHFAKEAAKNGNNVNTVGSSEDEEDVKRSSILESNNNQTIANKNGQFDGEEEFEPTKLLEQSMSTPENANVEYENEDGEEVNETNGNDDGFSSNNSNQDVSLMSTASDPSTVQVNKTIEEYEQILSEIQSKNLTTCPICSKEFIKKSKLIRHYHTHFSDFRPKFSCVFCGKLFTTQDWCKRHALNCQMKHLNSNHLNPTNITELFSEMDKD